MDVKIFVDSDIELDDERVESGPVGASGKKYGACGEVEVRANREKSADSILHKFKHKAVFQAPLHVSGENRNLPRSELVCITRLCNALRKAYQQEFVHLFAHGVRPRGDEAVRRNVGCQLIERLQYFHAWVKCRAHVSQALV